MRDFIKTISAYAKGLDDNFMIIPQNGHELLTTDGEASGQPSDSYIKSIDGVGREDLFYGYSEDNVATSATARDIMLGFMDTAEANNVEVLITDYCWTQSFVDDSYAQNAAKSYISFAADHRDLDSIPLYPEVPYNTNSLNIASLNQTQNFLYLLDPSVFSSKGAFLDALRATNFDLLIIDLFYDDQPLTLAEVASLKAKANGGSRLVIAYMSIGEAEDYRYYWQKEWEGNSPAWLAEENPDWEGNYKVHYWDSDWQNIIYGNDASYAKKIINAGFQGVYLDIIDAFEYFEEVKDENEGNNEIPGFLYISSFGTLVMSAIIGKKKRNNCSLKGD